MKTIIFILLFLFHFPIFAVDWNEFLFEASENGDLSKVKQALEKRAKINFQSPDNGEVTPLMIASEKGHLDIVKFLLVKKAKVNIKDSEEYHALMYAVRSGNLEIVKLLVLNKANVNYGEREIDASSSVRFSKRPRPVMSCT
jgi:ankyrin repeat protein